MLLFTNRETLKTLLPAPVTEAFHTPNSPNFIHLQTSKSSCQLSVFMSFLFVFSTPSGHKIHFHTSTFSAPSTFLFAYSGPS